MNEQLAKLTSRSELAHPFHLSQSISSTLNQTDGSLAFQEIHRSPTYPNCGKGPIPARNSKYFTIHESLFSSLSSCHGTLRNQLSTTLSEGSQSYNMVTFRQ